MNTTQISRRSALLVGAGATVGGASLIAGPAASAAPLKSAPAFPGQLRLGSTGSSVRLLQQSLAAAGYWLGSIDGSFGHQTQQAVWALQKCNGIERVGSCGPKTWNAAMSRRRPKPRSTATGIEIDLARQTLMVVENGVMQLTLNTSTGNGQYFYFRGRRIRAVTPKGNYSVWWRYLSGWQNGALGSMYKPAYFNGDIAVHGSPSIPPYPASHGCARVSTGAQLHLLRTGRLQKGKRIRVV